MKVTAFVYNDIYTRKINSTFLDELDKQSVDDHEIAALKCTGFLAKGDLARYKTMLIEHISRQSQNPAPKTLLDLGCGFGGLGRWLAKELNFQLLGIDFSKVAIEQACRTITASELSQINFKVADFSQTDIASQSISAVISLDALYLAAQPLATLKEIHRIMIPNGILIFTVYVQSSNQDSVPLNSKQSNWNQLLQKNGFLVTQYKDITLPWRKQMQKKHERRWMERERIRGELGELGEAELSVSAAMLGLDSKPSFLESVSRYEVVAICKIGRVP